MKKGFGFIILCFTYFLGIGQDEKRLEQPDIPRHYVGFWF